MATGASSSPSCTRVAAARREGGESRDPGRAEATGSSGPRHDRFSREGEDTERGEWLPPQGLAIGFYLSTNSLNCHVIPVSFRIGG